MTIDEAIRRLTEIRETAKFRGDTCLAICMEDVPYTNVESIVYREDPDGALVLVTAEET